MQIGETKVIWCFCKCLLFNEYILSQKRFIYFRGKPNKRESNHVYNVIAFSVSMILLNIFLRRRVILIQREKSLWCQSFKDFVFFLLYRARRQHSNKCKFSEFDYRRQIKKYKFDCGNRNLCQNTRQLQMNVNI